MRDDIAFLPGINPFSRGGAEIIRQLMKEHMINRYHISVIPTILGNGIRLFSPMEREVKLRLIRAQTWNGITDLHNDGVHTPDKRRVGTGILRAVVLAAQPVHAACGIPRIPAAWSAG